ncbi:Acetate kinase (Acetokinase) [Legionella lansingensis]|uniref:Acetate kinase n=1 Tax=Legionella lansingensis TaxID=45067 RepID=A0A0W0VL10_9GAMM|nr:acetate/propionate family kinase [Legionella lansingensis]KTD20794.1 acetate kinase [Legionella lansingensis]SNV49887.1 Acetate kinase (Acetokinase) [Legionella lansingensis]
MTAGVNSILVINAGSSSVKFQLFLREPALQLLAKGKVDNLGNHPVFTAMNETASVQNKSTVNLPVNFTHEDALQWILKWVKSQKSYWQVCAVAHRIVHGGTQFPTSVRVTPEVITHLAELCSLAPLHQPHNLAAIEMIAALMPGIPQIACFDTAFHANHGTLFTEYALPKKIRDKGIRRYGFHGLSYEWIAYALRLKAPKLAKGRVIAAHLGNGASLCAMHNGVSIDTTMGMTALDGLPMGTRCGQLDPGVVIYMIRDLGLSPDEVEAIFYQQSGLLALSEWTNDVSSLQDSKEANAQFALDYFCLKGAQLIGMMAVALGGVDAIVFTGGIGENSCFVREAILQRLAFLLPFETHVIPANEERMMAMHALSILE